MGIYSIGVDLVEIDRIGELIERYQDKFVNRVFTEAEISYCRIKRDNYESFAGRFASKEAVLKATGLGLRDGMTWHDIEILNDPMGRPLVTLHGKLADLLAGKNVHLSISHSKRASVAMVVVEERSG